MRRTFRPILILLLLVVMLAALILIFRQRPQPGPTPAKLVAHFLDIGQGDSELIDLPGGETVLIDSGDRGAPTVDLLRKYGVKQIDLIIATHPHSDHIGEMRDVMRSFKVKEFWDSGFNHPTMTYADMLQEIRDQGIKFATPRRGDVRKFGEVSLEVLNPAEQFVDESPNDASVVVRLTFGARRFLFAGDAEIPAWGQMMASAKDTLHADVLKAAHHGSSNGTTRDVLDAVRPSIFTISCAAGNDYHHPHPKVMRVLEEARDQIKPYRTDLEGTITVECDGNSIEVTADNQVARERLYLTGDEVASTVASDGRDATRHSRREGRRSR